MKHRTVEGFGKRLAQIRKSRGLTQAELGKNVGVSTRIIAYYELESDQPPGALLLDLAKVLRVSSDELLGLKPVHEKEDPKTARLLNRLRAIGRLSPADRRFVLKITDTLLKNRTVPSLPSVATAKELGQKILKLRRAAAR
jgi:transcriptional regulator with XRE-family HTH domain